MSATYHKPWSHSVRQAISWSKRLLISRDSTTLRHSNQASPITHSYRIRIRGTSRGRPQCRDNIQESQKRWLISLMLWLITRGVAGRAEQVSCRLPRLLISLGHCSANRLIKRARRGYRPMSSRSVRGPDPAAPQRAVRWLRYAAMPSTKQKWIAWRTKLISENDEEVRATAKWYCPKTTADFELVDIGIKTVFLKSIICYSIKLIITVT